jgi:hypothetical protein
VRSNLAQRQHLDITAPPKLCWELTLCPFRVNANLAACERCARIGSTPGPPNIPDEIPDPVTVISLKLTKGKFRQGCHGHGRATNNSKFYSTLRAQSFRLATHGMHGSFLRNLDRQENSLALIRFSTFASHFQHNESQRRRVTVTS